MFSSTEKASCQIKMLNELNSQDSKTQPDDKIISEISSTPSEILEQSIFSESITCLKKINNTLVNIIDKDKRIVKLRSTITEFLQSGANNSRNVQQAMSSSSQIQCTNELTSGKLTDCTEVEFSEESVSSINLLKRQDTPLIMAPALCLSSQSLTQFNKHSNNGPDFLVFVVSQLEFIREEIRSELGKSIPGITLIKELDFLLEQPSTSNGEVGIIVSKAIILEEELKREISQYKEQQALHSQANFRSFLEKVQKQAFESKFPTKKLFISHAWPLIDDPFNDAWSENFLTMFVEHLNWAGLIVYFDKKDSGAGKLLYKFMNNKIDKADHILVICTRTMKYKFDNHGLTGACYEYLRYMQNYCKEREKRESYIIPICLTKNGNEPGLVGLFVESSIFEHGYLYVFLSLLRSVYGFGHKFWKDLKKNLTPEENSYLENNEFSKKLDCSILNSNPKHQNQAMVVNHATGINNQITFFSKRNFQFPIICNIEAPVDSFVEREDILKYIKKSADTRSFHVLWGMGGIGKTQLGKQFAKKNQSSYAIIWWLDSERLIDDYKKLAANLNKKMTELKLEQQIDVTDSNFIDNIITALDYVGNWLLIFDDLDINQIKFIPKRIIDQKNGHIVITSRYSNWPYQYLIEVSHLKPDQSIKMLEPITKGDEAKNLAIKLGHLPLALAQAVGYLKNNPCININQYIKMFDDINVCSRLFLKNYSNENERTLNTIWEISETSICKSPEGKLAREILYYCAYLGINDIPVFLFEQLGNNLNVSDAVRKLLDYSLLSINKDKNSVSIHPLMQLILQNKIKEEKLNKLAEFLGYINKSFPSEENTKDPNLQRNQIRPHLEKIVAFAKVAEDTYIKSLVGTKENCHPVSNSNLPSSSESKMEDKDLDIAMCNLGIANYSCGYLNEAIKYLAEAVSRLTSTSTKLMAVCCNGYLEKAYRYDGQFEQALIYAKTELELTKELHGESHHLVADIYVNSGYNYMGLKNYPEALRHFENSLKICKAHYANDRMGENNSSFDHAYLALGNYYTTLLQEANESSQEKLEHGNEAKKYYVTAANIRKQLYPANHGYLSTIPGNLGAVELLLENPTEALSHLQESLDINNLSQQGRDNPGMANILNHMSKAYYMLNQYTQSFKYADDAVRIFQDTYGLKHIRTAKALYNKGSALLKLPDINNNRTNGIVCLVSAQQIAKEKNDVKLESSISKLLDEENNKLNPSHILQFTR